MSRGETCCKMAPVWSRTLVRCSAVLLVLQAFLHVTSATDVVRFDQSGKSENDIDNIYDILEDEQFFIVDKKLSKGKPKVQVPAVFNLTAPGVHHSKQSTLVDKNLVGTTTESVRTTAAPIVHHSGITSHANAVGDEGEFENDLVDDFLIFSQDRERVEKMEERRREEEQDLARRVRRQVVEGTGVSSVNAEVTVDRQWISNYSDPSTNEFTTLQSQSETSLTNQLSSLPQTTTVAVTGFRQGSVIIEFTVSYPNDDVDRAALARQLLSIRDNGLTLGSNTDTVLGEPELTDGSDTDTLRASTCYLCRSYQTCLLDNSTSHYYCQVSSSDFFTFGRAQKDNTLQNNKERVAKKLKVPGGIPVVDQTVNEVYVSMNGLISFGQRYGAFSPRPLPRRNRQLMCGYWADMQLLSSDSSSSVWYHAYEKTDSNTTEEQTVLNEANNMVALYGDVTGFSASFVLVVTFEEMPPDPTNDDTDERVNFQMVLISDGSITYGMFIYASGAMQWNEALQRRVTIGYLEETFPISSARPDTEIGNTNRPGVWFFTLGQLPEVTENPEQKCLDWYYSNLPNRNSYNAISRLIPTCPCSYTLAFFSNEWIPEDNNGELPKCFVIAPFHGQWGKRCCYTPRLSYERNRPEAGSFLLHHPWVNEAQNYENDVLPKQYCCEQSDLCALYYDVRPTDTCQRIIVIIIAIGRGDPHINTLDGKTFPFNAIGEFTLIKIDLPAQKFDLQARTCQARSSSGDPVAASIFCGFVARGNGSEKFQVELNNNRSGMVIYANDQDLTLTYEQEGNLFNRTIGGLVLRRSNNTIRATFQEGVSINITVEYQLLTIEVGVKETLEGFTGLLGNRNGNPEDDFIFPNGTTLPGNTTERDLLAYGKSWALTNQTSLFRYQAGYNTDSYTNDSFVPIFLSEVNQTLITQAETTCGSADVGCIFDFIVTGDTDLALGTKQASDAAALVKSTAENESPVLDGPARINVTVSVQTNFTLNASDHEDQQQLTYNIISQPAEGFSFDNDTQTGTWTPVNNDTSKIEIAVTDSQGAQSPSLKIEIVLCSYCNGRGTCDFETFRTQVGDEYYKLAVCECEPYYEGDDCENDFDACADEPCPVGTTCMDFTIDKHIAAGADSPGYNCSSCPNGYTYNETVLNCYDIDECAVGNCNQTCTNTVGSFSCGCNLGYRLSPPVTGTDCNDIDECADGTNDCAQTCTNTVGSFTCDCYPGFTLDADGRTCIKDAATDPCASLTNNCEYACQNQSGVAVCQCPNGYTLADNNYNCTDVDECSQNVCSQLCNNTDGGFVCSCYTGYSLDADQVSCSECTGNTYGVNCNETCECRGRGTCDKVRGCQCNSGWTGTTCSDDVNECVTLAAPCPSGQICSNTNGSYTCSCPTGYRKINITTCEDIDECAAPTLNNCKQVCTNTVGSYTCSCNTGYTYDSATNTCQDIDECATQLSQCEQLCVNYPGSANCECRSGFLLNDDRKTCAKERDPCAVLSDSKNCSYGCEISQSGVATCYCPSGYELAVDEVTCVDINECTNNATNQCSQQCDNAPGSYICSCSIGYRLDNSQRNCTGCDAYHWGEDCANDCNCSPLGTDYCDSVTGCVCKEGWLGTTCELDRDECSSNPCPANAACTDTAGSYQCDCNAGYASNATANTCDDVNECDDSPCDQTCTNSVGSYVCSCSTGFNSVGDSCVDIDECLSNPCSQICRNTIGGFACECYNGFLLNMTTRTTCYAQTECVSTTCEQNCRVVGGTEKCICNAGYTVNATDSSICDDDDECQNNPCINGTCTNTPGAFTCTCANGTYLMGDDLTCAVCPQGSFGQNCASNCTCNTTNTNICEAETGACQCKTGWTGTTCDDNEDECRMNSAICDGVPNSSCVDSPGSYSCVCNNGFFTSSGSCYACDDVSWGTECSQTCSCARANTLDCNDTTGACTCNQYWTGDNCTQDINECTVDPNICNAALFEVCRNFDGGYSCDCVSGYHRPSPGDNCTDLDECLYTNLNTCNRTTEICLNTEGSFVCNCSTGFAANSNGVCDDFDECAANTDACSQTCVNTFGSYTCACNSGYTLNADGITCDDIDECANPSLNNCTDKEDCTNTDGSFSCSCKSGYVRGSLGICIATYQNYSLTITLDITANEPLTDKATNYYAELLQLIQEALRSFLSGTVGQPFHAVLISDLRSGSVVVDAELQIDASKTTNPEGLAAKGSRDLVQAQSLTVNGTAYAVNAVEYNNATVTQALTVCETFALFKTCAADEVCEEVNGVPQCRVIQEEESDYKLIIGLSVGIPLFFIFAVIIAVLIYMCVKRQREAEQTRPEPSEDRFRSVFASQIPTKGSWGAPHRYQMYSPDTLSDATSESSGEGQLLKGRRQGRTDFQDSAWYDNRGAAAPDGQRGPPRTPRDPAEGATSNFSWEYMFRLLEPYRGFEIQRPAVHSDPNPAFTPRRKRPDSMA